MTTLQQQSESDSAPWTIANRNAETLSAAGIFGKRQSATSGLTWAFYGGLYSGNTIADGTVTLTNAASNYVVVLRSTGVVSTSTSSANSLNPLYAKLYQLTTAGGVVTAEVDQRTDANGLLFNSGAAGTVTSVTASGGVQTATGSPITGADTIRAAAVFNAQTGTTYTVLTGDRGKLVTLSNAGAIAVTLPVAGGTFPDGWFADLQCIGAGTVTITPTTSTINGAATLVLTTGQSARIVSDGTNYRALTGGSSGGGGGDAYPAFEYTSETGSTADSDPGAGLFKWNNATQASATFLYFDDVTADGSASDLSTFFASLGSSGFIHIINAANEAQFQVWKWTATPTDGTGYWKFAVTLQTSVSLADAVVCKVAFIPLGGSGGSTQGRHDVWVSAGAIVPAAVNGCLSAARVTTASLQPDILSVDFDPTTQWFGQFHLVMPKSWNGGTITFHPYWSHAATTVNFGVVWQLQAVAVRDADTIAVNYGTAQTSTDTGGTTNVQYIGPESSAITIGGTIGTRSVVYFQVARVPANGSDTMAINARLHGMVIGMTTNADTDA